MRTKRPIIVKSIARAVNILKTLDLNHTKVSDIARELKLSNSTVYRLLQTLREVGLVTKESNGHEYYPGYLFIMFASDPLTTHRYLIHYARPAMEHLRMTTGETVSLDIKLGMEKVKLTRLTGTRTVTFLDTDRRTADPMWIGANGKILLSQLSETDLNSLLDKIEMTALTPRTITDKAILKQEVLKAKQQEYATSFGEAELGVAGIAVPINNYIHPVSLSIIGPENRLTSNFNEYLKVIKDKANQISLDLPKLKIF